MFTLYCFGLYLPYRCGKAFGLGGMIWGRGLDSQVDLVHARITRLLNGAGGSSIDELNPLTVNCVGLSRGACACLLVAQACAHWPMHVAVNLFLFDPGKASSSFAFCRYS